MVAGVVRSKGTLVCHFSLGSGPRFPRKHLRSPVSPSCSLFWSSLLDRVPWRRLQTPSLYSEVFGLRGKQSRPSSLTDFSRGALRNKDLFPSSEPVPLPPRDEHVTGTEPRVTHCPFLSRRPLQGSRLQESDLRSLPKVSPSGHRGL